MTPIGENFDGYDERDLPLETVLLHRIKELERLRAQLAEIQAKIEQWNDDPNSCDGIALAFSILDIIKGAAPPAGGERP